MSQPKVSVLMITYNHEKFIAQAIESALMQETNFDFEIVIGEDCSTDKTRSILLDYVSRYPDRIRVLLPKNKLGMHLNFIQTYEACQGEFIAILEGDDYWTNSHKLQKQVDFLCLNLHYVSCFHNVLILREDQIQAQSYCPPDQRMLLKLEDLIIRNPIPTCSVLFRNGLISDFPHWIFKTPNLDSAFHIILASFGDVGYIDEIMGVYRIHSGGVWSGRTTLARHKGAIRFSYLLACEIPSAMRPKLREVTLHLCEVLGSMIAVEAQSYVEAQREPISVAQVIAAFLDSSLQDLTLDAAALSRLKATFYPALMFWAHQKGDAICVRHALPRAILKKPALLMNRGVLSMTMKYFIGGLRPTIG